MEEDKDRDAEAVERHQAVQQRRKDIAAADTVAKKVEMETLVVKAKMELALAQERLVKEVPLANASSEAEAARVRAEEKRDAAKFEAEGAIASTKEKNDAQLSFLKQQAALLGKNPGLVELLKIQNDLFKTEALASAAKTNPMWCS